MSRSVPLEVIDFHSHHVSPSWPLTTPVDTTKAEQRRWKTINQLLASESALLEQIEAGDIAARVINTPTALFTAPGSDVPADTFSRINDELAELVARHPGRLHALASVDGFGGDAGAKELIRAVRDLGLRGVFLDSAKGDLLLDAPQVRPTLQTAAALGVPVFAHPVNPQPLSRQLAPYGRLGTLLARGTVNAATLVALLESGIFDELPSLQVVVTTLAIGGVLLAGGFSDASGVRRDAASLLLKHVYIDTMHFHPVLIRSAIDLLGVDHVLIGSDWPIVSDGPINERVARAFTAVGLTETEQRQIANGNTARLLGLHWKDGIATRKAQAAR